VPMTTWISALLIPVWLGVTAVLVPSSTVAAETDG